MGYKEEEVAFIYHGREINGYDYKNMKKYQGGADLKYNLQISDTNSHICNLIRKSVVTIMIKKHLAFINVLIFQNQIRKFQIQIRKYLRICEPLHTPEYTWFNLL